MIGELRSMGNAGSPRREDIRYEGIGIREYFTLDGKLKVGEDEIRGAPELVGIPYELYVTGLIDKSLSGGMTGRNLLFFF